MAVRPAASSDVPVGRDGWGVIWALGVTQVVSWGSLYYPFPLLLGPIELELGWHRATVVGAFSLSLLVAGVAAFPVGVLIDRFGGRTLMAWGSFTAAVLLALLSRTGSLGGFYVIWAGLGLCLAATLYEPALASLALVFRTDLRKAITCPDTGRRVCEHGLLAADCNGSNPRWAGARRSSSSPRTNPFVGGEIQKEANRKRVLERTHNFLGSKMTEEQFRNGSHPFLDRDNIVKGGKAGGKRQSMLEYHCDVCGRSGFGNRFKGSHFSKCASGVSDLHGGLKAPQD